MNKIKGDEIKMNKLLDLNNQLKLFAIFGFITGVVMFGASIIIAVEYEKLKKDFYNTQYSYAKLYEIKYDAKACEVLLDNGYKGVQN